jgi:hypothetical protein
MSGFQQLITRHDPEKKFRNEFLDNNVFGGAV